MDRTGIIVLGSINMDLVVRVARMPRPGWPSQAERDEDLATHLRVIEVLRRAPACRR